MSSLLTAWERFVGDDNVSGSLEWWQIAVRSVILYTGGLLIVRWGKSRLLGHATPLDMILAFMLGSLLSRAILGATTILNAFVASITLVALHWLFSWLAMQSHRWGNLIKGTSYELVKDGKIISENMRRAHLSEHDLFEQLRLRANVNDLGDVEVAYKERSGEVGVVIRKPH